MKYFYILLVFVITGCATVDKTAVTTEEAGEAAVVTEVKAEGVETTQYVYLFDVLQKYPKSGLGIVDNWVIVKVDNSAEKSVWSFPPVTHPAFPAAVKRQIIEQDGTIQIKTQINCDSGKFLCDLLFQDFIAMSEKVLE